MDFYNNITSLDNLLVSWTEFLRGKKRRGDLMEFSENLSGSIYALHLDLRNKAYQHSGYQAFNISDPKPRSIHKPSVRDRLLHHAIYRVLYPYFDRKFIADSYSCRLDKGTHRALLRFESFGRKVSRNDNRQCWVLKCDIRKFFASIDQRIMFVILKKHLKDEDTLNLFKKIIISFSPGLPLGNLTSQLLVNIYMNEFDQFVKHKLKAKYYIRYADDFVFLSDNKGELVDLIPQVESFMENELKLKLHYDKVFIKTLSSGVDFLGWVHFPHHRALRTATKRRMLKKLLNDPSSELKASYMGLLKYGNTHKLQKMLP